MIRTSKLLVKVFGFTLCLSICGVYCLESIPLTLPYDGYYCYLKCLAGCIESTKIERITDRILDDCIPDCEQHENQTQALCPKDDVKCWKQLCDNSRANEVSSVNDIPKITSVHFSMIPQLDPRSAALEWTPVVGAKFYIVQYVEADDTFKTWATGGLGQKLTTQTKTTINKSNLCPEYQFRVAAVNKNKISYFSSIVTLEKPIPIMSNPSVEVIDSVLQNVPYKDVTGTFSWNETVRTIIEFTPPHGFNLKSKEIEPVFLQPFLLGCKGKQDNFPLPKTISDPNREPYVYYEFPSFVVDKECSFIITLSEIKSKCGTSYKYPPNSGILIVNFTCENTRNSTCNQREPVYSPTCNLNVTSQIQPYMANVSRFVPVHLNWSIPLGKKPSAIKCYILNISQTEKPIILEPFTKSTPIIENTLFRNTCHHYNDTQNEATFDSLFEAGKYYNVRLCAVYEQSSNASIDWNLAMWYSVDLTDKNIYPVIFKEDSDRLGLAKIVPAVAAVVFVAMVAAVVAVICVKRNYVKKKSLNEIAEGERYDEYGNLYSDMPRRFDVWELPRNKLIIYEDQKLGSGAFGSVYKGQIMGQLLNHKDANSVLAENWMKAENCEVAVKMLPEYADDSSKSDFRKEINLMKQIGHHERLVNMLACITADEPLCLVVDYCSDGDLLHYLRDRRQYMIKLEAVGIDINTLPEDSDVDFSMILCLKDLIAFAWQISVGLEYLSQKKFIHRDVAARNVLVDKGKKAKIGDFGLCRYSCSDPIYMGKGGRLPIKWMALEAIKSYEFTTKSDVWSFGVLLFEIITLGGSPYPGVQPSDMQQTLEAGKRMEQPDNCPTELYQMMLETWMAEPDKRPIFTDLREELRKMLEEITEDYYYMSLNSARDYYNVVYGEELESKVNQPSGSDDRGPSTSNGYRINPNAKMYFNKAYEPDSPSDVSPKASVVKPPVPPRSLRQSSSDSVFSTATATSSDDSSSGKSSNHRYSSNSEQMLITPTSDNYENTPKFKFFKLKPTVLEDLPESGTSNGYEPEDKLRNIHTGYMNTVLNQDDEL